MSRNLRPLSTGSKRRTSRAPIILILLLVLIVGAVVYFSMNVEEQPQTTIEEEISLEGDGDA